MSYDPLRAEEQRARLQNLLRNCKMALMIVVDQDDTLVTAHFNCSVLELLGLRHKILESAEALVGEEEIEFFMDEDDEDPER